MNRALIDAGDETNAVDYVAATAELRGWSRRVVAFLDDYDLLLTPTLAQPPAADRRADRRGRSVGSFAQRGAVHAVHAGCERHRPAGRLACRSPGATTASRSASS